MGDSTMAQPFGAVAIAFGILLVIFALRSKPIRKIHGVGNKLRAFASDSFDGPDQWGRVFFAGLGFIIIGAVWLWAKPPHWHLWTFSVARTLLQLSHQ